LKDAALEGLRSSQGKANAVVKESGRAGLKKPHHVDVDSNLVAGYL